MAGHDKSEQADHRIELPVRQPIMTTAGIADPNVILDKKEKFFATAAVLEKLLPYYRHAAENYPHTYSHGPEAEDGHKKFTLPMQGDLDHFPPGLGDLVLGHLTALQGNALLLEALGKTTEADEVREVAKTLADMLNLTQSYNQARNARTGHSHV